MFDAWAFHRQKPKARRLISNKTFFFIVLVIVVNNKMTCRETFHGANVELRIWYPKAIQIRETIIFNKELEIKVIKNRASKQFCLKSKI